MMMVLGYVQRFFFLGALCCGITAAQDSRDVMHTSHITSTTSPASTGLLLNHKPAANKTVVCPELALLKHGDMKLYGLTENMPVPGSEVEYQCRVGYILKGDSERHCQPNGHWSGIAPYCAQQIAFCVDPGSFENGSVFQKCPDEMIMHNGNCFKNPQGTELHFECANNFELFGNRVITCLQSGQWSDTKPKCVHKATCKLPAIKNGYVPEKPGGVLYVVGDVTNVECDADLGYRLREHSMIVCQPDGSWVSGSYLPFPQCIKSCSPPPAILHGISHLYKYNRLQRSFQSIEDGQVAIYRCNSGYELKKHNSNRLLCSGGQWIGRLPVCVKRTHCPPPVDIAYGNWVIIGEFPNYPIYTRIRYECSAGYAPQKPVFITCLKNGFWSDNPPKCEMYCPNPGEIENGRTACKNTRCTKPQYRVRDEVHYVCDDDYEPDGEIKLVCMKGHKWSSRKPVCLPAVQPTAPSSHLEVSAGTGTLTVVIVTSCGVLGVLLIIMVVVALHLRKLDTSRFCRPVEPPTPPPYTGYERPRSNSVEEHDRMALIAFADGVQVVLPSYEEAVRNRPSVTPARQHSVTSRHSSHSSEYRPLPSIPSALRGRHDSVRSGPALREHNHDNLRNSTITMNSTNTNNASELFGSLDTVNVSDGTSTTVTIDTFSSGMSNPSITTSRHTAAGSLASSNGSLANEVSPLLDNTVSSHGNPGMGRTSGEMSTNSISEEISNKSINTHQHSTDEEMQGMLEAVD